MGAKPTDDFARALGDAFDNFLQERGMSRAEASRQMHMGRATVNNYCHDTPEGKRIMASAEFLVKACALGFVFETDGHRIGELSQTTLNGHHPNKNHQLPLPFTRSFALENDHGNVSVSVKRPAGRVEVSVSVKAVS